VLPLITVLREGRLVYATEPKSSKTLTVHYRHGSCHFRRRRLAWATCYFHSDCDNCWSNLRIDCWFLDISIREQNQLVFHFGLTISIILTIFHAPALTIFLIAMTNLLLLIGAGLFSRAVGAFQENAFNQLLGADVDDAGGDGPGSYPVAGNVWHLDCCNLDDNLDNSGWSVFNAILGWTNNGCLGTILSYVFYWIAVMVTLLVMKYHEVSLFRPLDKQVAYPCNTRAALKFLGTNRPLVLVVEFVGKNNLCRPVRTITSAVNQRLLVAVVILPNCPSDCLPDDHFEHGLMKFEWSSAALQAYEELLETYCFFVLYILASKDRFECVVSFKIKT